MQSLTQLIWNRTQLGRVLDVKTGTRFGRVLDAKSDSAYLEANTTRTPPWSSCTKFFYNYSTGK